MNDVVRHFNLIKDEQGYAMAIAVDGWFLIHLERGAVRNEENAATLVAVLNTAVATIHKECGVKSLRMALEAIMLNGRCQR